MAFTLEAFLLAIFGILPGFVSSTVHATLRPDERTSAGEWIAASIVTSLGLNACTLLIFLLATDGVDLSRALTTIKDQLGERIGFDALWYVGVLYALSILWGAATGYFGSKYAPRQLAYQLRLTPISPAQNVFRDVIGSFVRTRKNLRLHDDPAQEVPWLRIQRKEVIVFGRLVRSSPAFERDQPIEVFLSPAYVIEGSDFSFQTIPESNLGPCIKEQYKGLYLRLLSDDLIHVFVVRADWTPKILPKERVPEFSEPVA